MTQDGTIVDCQGCGVCCLHVSIPPFRPGEIADLATAVADEIAQHRRRAGDQNNGPCAWFDEQTRLCRHHELRPAACREFALGGETCLLVRTHYGIGQVG